MYEVSKIGFVLQSGMGGVGGLFIFLLEESKSISHDSAPRANRTTLRVLWHNYRILRLE